MVYHLLRSTKYSGNSYTIFCLHMVHLCLAHCGLIMAASDDCTGIQTCPHITVHAASTCAACTTIIVYADRTRRSLSLFRCVCRYRVYRTVATSYGSQIILPSRTLCRLTSFFPIMGSSTLTSTRPLPVDLLLLAEPPSTATAIEDRAAAPLRSSG